MSKRKTYSREYKIGAIQMVEQKGMTMREASEALGINHGMLWSSKLKYRPIKLLLKCYEIGKKYVLIWVEDLV